MKILMLMLTRVMKKKTHRNQMMNRTTSIILNEEGQLGTKRLEYRNKLIIRKNLVLSLKRVSRLNNSLAKGGGAESWISLSSQKMKTMK